MGTITKLFIAAILVVCVSYTLAGIPCKAGETMQKSCNTCFCADGLWACTLIGCPDENVAIHPLPAALECTPGETKRLGCNQCKCLAGVWACTRKACA